MFPQSGADTLVCSVPTHRDAFRSSDGLELPRLWTREKRRHECRRGKQSVCATAEPAKTGSRTHRLPNQRLCFAMLLRRDSATHFWSVDESLRFLLFRGGLRFKRFHVIVTTVEEPLQVRGRGQQRIRHLDVLGLNFSVGLAQLSLVFLQEFLSLLGRQAERQFAFLAQIAEHVPVQRSVRNRVAFPFHFGIGGDQSLVQIHLVRWSRCSCRFGHASFLRYRPYNRFAVPV